VKFGTLELPHVTMIKQQTTRTYFEVPLPYRAFDYKADLGGQGSAFTIDGYVESQDAVTKAQISALADGTARILDLEEPKLQPFDNVFNEIFRVQGPAFATAGGSSTLTDTLTLTPTNGNTLIALISINCNSTEHVSSITQTGVTWTPQVTKNWSGQFSVEIWKGVVGPNAGKSALITLNTTPRNGPSADICEYIGPLTLDQSATNQGTATNGDSGTAALTSQAQELEIAGITSWEGTETTPTNGFLLLDGNTNNGVMQGYYEKLTAVVGAPDVGCTFSAGNLNFVGCIATFISLLSWPDYTSLAQLGTGSFTFLTATTDYAYFGYHEKFNKLPFTVGTPGLYNPILWQYSQGNSLWNTLNLVLPYDDFTRYALDPTLWTLTQGNAANSNSICTLSNQANLYSYPGSRFSGTDPYPPYQIVAFRMSVAQTTSQIEVHPIDNNNDNVFKFIFNTNGTLTLVLSQHPNYVYTTVPGNYDTAMHNYIVTWLPGLFQFFRDGVLLWSVTQTNSIPSMNFGFGVIFSDAVSSCQIDYFGTYGDTTQFLQQNGTITLTPPSDWATDTVNGSPNKFWLRAGSPYGVTTVGTIKQVLMNPCFNCIMLNPLWTYDVTIWDYVAYELTFQQQENPTS